MNSLEQQISTLAKAAVKALYGVEADDSQIQLQKTRPEFEGNITLVVFPFVKIARKAPAQVAAEIGEWLMANGEELIAKYNAVQGFLNLSISDAFWIDQLKAIDADEHYGHFEQPSEKALPFRKGEGVGSPLMMVEYSSPNTNKPLHLGHVRNNL
ncbi:MAG: arginine--tRNA ligase, partial [Paludibacteraceae bacterium]|nr:arginine--tRNA ligase [Paludibacteraceae bacterium]